MDYRYTLFPEIEPYEKGHIKYLIYTQFIMKRQGTLKETYIIFTWGPGAGLDPMNRRFDPKFYRIILFDQRL